MSRLSIVTSTAMLAVLVLPVNAAEQTLRQQLVGTWIMTSCDVKTPWCPNGNGSLALTGSGRYTLVIFARDRPKLTGANPIDRASVSADQYKGIGQGTVAQFGTWSVNEADKTLTQHVENSFFGGGQAGEFKFCVSLNGDELKLVSSSGNNDPRDLGSGATWKKR